MLRRLRSASRRWLGRRPARAPASSIRAAFSAAPWASPAAGLYSACMDLAACWRWWGSPHCRRRPFPAPARGVNPAARWRPGDALSVYGTGQFAHRTCIATSTPAMLPPTQGIAMKLAVPDMISNSYFPAIAAAELGLFRKEGLDIEVELIFPVDKAYMALRDG